MLAILPPFLRAPFFNISSQKSDILPGPQDLDGWQT